MMRLALTAIATLTAADPVMADLAVAERVFSWRSNAWSVFGTPGDCVAGPIESTVLELSWGSDRDGGIAVSANHPIGDMDPRAVWRLLASTELQIVPISRGRASGASMMPSGTSDGRSRFAGLTRNGPR